MAKKFANYDEAAEALKAAKEELAVAREEKKTYFKENQLSLKQDYADDAKHGKKVKKLNDMVEKKVTQRDEIEAWMKENKPKKERAARAVKYTYPDDVQTADEKKKYRAKMRAEKKRKEKGEDEADKPKKSKKKDKEKETPAEDTSSKKSKKDKSKKKDKEKSEAAED